MCKIQTHLAPHIKQKETVLTGKHSMKLGNLAAWFSMARLRTVPLVDTVPN